MPPWARYCVGHDLPVDTRFDVTPKKLDEASDREYDEDRGNEQTNPEMPVDEKPLIGRVQDPKVPCNWSAVEIPFFFGGTVKVIRRVAISRGVLVGVRG